MIQNQRYEEEKITKDIKNIFRLKKRSYKFKDLVHRSIKNLFIYKGEENYYQPVRVNNNK